MGSEVNMVLLVFAIVSIETAVIRSSTPSNGDITLNGEGSNVSSGPLQVYFNGEFISVCATGFNKVAADTACRQLGYSGSINYTSISTPENEGSGASFLPLSPILSIVSCLSTQLHILRCIVSSDLICDHSNIVNLTCDGNLENNNYYKGEVRLSNGTYKSRGLLEIYLNSKWGTVCSEQFTMVIGSVICRQLGYTNAVRYNRYPFVNNERTVWLRDLNCKGNTSDLSCFKNCYVPPIIRNIYCGNSDDVELECSFNTSLAFNTSLEKTGNGVDDTREACAVEITPVHISIIVILIVIFSIVFLIYAVLFIGRFIVAAWHKSDRYKIQEPERRYKFDAYHNILKRNSAIQLSESARVKSDKTNISTVAVVIENNEQEEDFK